MVKYNEAGEVLMTSLGRAKKLGGNLGFSSKRSWLESVGRLRARNNHKTIFFI